LHPLENAASQPRAQGRRGFT